MARETIIKCDVCEIIKKDINNWWKVWVEHGELHLIPSDAFDDNYHSGLKDVCGKHHALEMFNRYLETGQIDKPVSVMLTEQPD